MDFDLPPDDDPRRLEIRAWLATHPKPSARQLHNAGYVVPHWPKPYGIDADPMHQLIIHEELRAAKVSGPANPIGIGWAARATSHLKVQQLAEASPSALARRPKATDPDARLRDIGM